MPDLPCRGGGVNPTSMAQNDTHVALIILTTQMWGGGGGEILVEKTFSGQNLCSCASGTNIRSYTKQRARHGTPFLQPPPLLRRASMSPPPPLPAEQFSGCLSFTRSDALQRSACPEPGGLVPIPCKLVNRRNSLIEREHTCSRSSEIQTQQRPWLPAWIHMSLSDGEPDNVGDDGPEMRQEIDHGAEVPTRKGEGGEAAMHWKQGGGGVNTFPGRPAYVTALLAPSAGLNGICNRQ